MKVEFLRTKQIEEVRDLIHGFSHRYVTDIKDFVTTTESCGFSSTEEITEEVPKKNGNGNITIKEIIEQANLTSEEVLRIASKELNKNVTTLKKLDKNIFILYYTNIIKTSNKFMAKVKILIKGYVEEKDGEEFASSTTTLIQDNNLNVIVDPFFF